MSELRFVGLEDCMIEDSDELAIAVLGLNCETCWNNDDETVCRNCPNWPFYQAHYDRS